MHMPAISVRLKTRSAAKTGGDRGHNERLDEAPDYVDQERTPDNTVPIPMPAPEAMAEECLGRRQAGFKSGLAPSGKPRRMPRSMAKNAVVSVSGIITFSIDAQPAIDALSPAEQDELFQASAEAVADQYNTDLAGLAIHRDESALHAHFTLHGYDLAGDPISKKMTKAALSKSQDTATAAFADLGITRGVLIGDRIAAGEPRSKTVNRSVHQLHNDLPRELAAAQQRVASMQNEVEKTAETLVDRERELAAKDEKSAAQDKQIAKLESRLTTYEKRLTDRTAEVERLEALVTDKIAQIAALDTKLKSKKQQLRKFGASTDMPQPSVGTITQKPQKTNKLRKPKPPEPKQIRYYTVTQVHEFVGGLKTAAETAQERHKSLKSELTKRTRNYQYVRKNEDPSGDRAQLNAVSQVLDQRYGLMVAETNMQATVPPQKHATPIQIANALYRISRKKWSEAHFTVRDKEADKIIDMAIQDGRTELISFDDMGQRMRLVKAEKEADRAAQEASETPRQPKPPQTGFFDEADDEPKGPTLG